MKTLFVPACIVALCGVLVFSSCKAQVINPEVTQATIGKTICVPGWTATIRPPASYTNRIKRDLINATAAADVMEDYELDHVLPLSVGGHPTDPKNLKLQLWDGPDGAHAKDIVEVRMKKMVCNHKITLAKAQACFFKGWQTCPR